MRKILVCLVSAGAMLSLATTSYGLILGDFEDGLGNWSGTWEAKAGLSVGTTGATLGSHSLVITPVKNAFSWAVMYNCPAPIDLSKFARISADVTWVASEWAPQSGIWVQLQLVAINSDGPSGWKQYMPIDPVNTAYPGSWDPASWGDQTRHLSWDISGYDATGATWMQIIFSTNMGNVETAGNYYIDNVRVTAAPPKVAWVSFHIDENAASAGAVTAGFTAAPDKGYTDLLKANGFDVVRYLQSGTPDVNALNAADVVIISRSVASTSFQGAAATTWNTMITAPIINMSGYTLRKSRLGFSTGNTIPDTTGDIKLTAVAPHPIFTGVSLMNGTMDANFAGIATYPDGVSKALGISVNTDPVPADGTIIATISADSAAAGPAGAMIIGEWPAGTTVVHDGGAGTDILAGRRMTFLSGSREASGKNSEGTGMIDLTDDGQKMFVNAVEYLVPALLSASEPRPADGATGVPLNGTLVWDSGKLAVQHQVFISSKKDDVVSGKALIDVVTTNSYNLKPLGMILGTTYYWKIVEINGDSKWESPVWSFTAIDYIAVDDFESYASSNIAKTWADGLKVEDGVASGGSVSVASSAHTGAQSMAITYDCSKNPFQAEFGRTYSTKQNWTAAGSSGATTLVVFFHGDPNNGVQPLYVEVNGYAVTYSGGLSNLAKTDWTQWNISLSSLPINIGQVQSLDVGVGYGRQMAAPLGTQKGAKGVVYIDDIRLYRVAPK